VAEEVLEGVVVELLIIKVKEGISRISEEGEVVEVAFSQGDLNQGRKKL
jgi:hypothetical protein